MAAPCAITTTKTALLSDARAQKFFTMADQFFQGRARIEFEDAPRPKLLHRLVRGLLRPIGGPPSVGDIHSLRCPQAQAFFSYVVGYPTMNSQKRNFMLSGELRD